MSQIRIIDSPQTHILLLGCNDVEFEGLFIKSPDGSPNTDGIHIHTTNNVFINSSFIGVGNCLSPSLLQTSEFLLYIHEIALIWLLHQNKVVVGLELNLKVLNTNYPFL